LFITIFPFESKKKQPLFVGNRIFKESRHGVFCQRLTGPCHAWVTPTPHFKLSSNQMVSQAKQPFLFGMLIRNSQCNPRSSSWQSEDLAFGHGF
jgi:hypothetical protein